MNDENAGRAEQISALVDGELNVGEFSAVAESVTNTREGRVTWQAYHVVGDALRGTAHAAMLDGDDFVGRLRSRMAAQGVQPQSVRSAGTAVAATPATAAREGANDPVMRWKLLAGFASLAAVAVLGWHVASLEAPSDGLAQAISAPRVPVAVAPAASIGEQQTAVPVMLRDARLDELLAAHKQFGGTSALQMPAGFMRNATFDASNR